MKDNNHLFISGVDTVELAKKYGTPLYVISEDKIVEKINILKKSFINKYKNVKVLYASKAFMTLAIANIIKREGLGIDIVSGGELFTALKVDFDTDKIHFHGNNKTIEELEFALESNVGNIVVDNENELDNLIMLSKKYNKKIDIYLRLSPGLTGIDTHKHIITGQRDTKFGFQINDYLKESIIKKIFNCDGLWLKGFHSHIGSQLFDESLHLKAFDVIFELVRELKKIYNFNIESLNIGGGFGIKYTEGDKELDIEKLLEGIMESINKKFLNIDMERPEIIIEPGRWIVGEAGVTLYKAGAIKEIEKLRTYITIDGGMSDNIRPALYDAKYSADIANKIKNEKVEMYTVAGKACESGDVLIKDVKLPVVEYGDILVIYSTGAYGFSMASNYNRIRIPAVVLIKEGKDYLIVKRQSYDDIISRDLVPNYIL